MVKKHLGVQKDPGNTDHIEERGNWEEKVHLGKTGCVCVGSLVFLGTGTKEPMVRGEELKKTGKRVPVTSKSKESEVQDTG